MRLEKSAEFGRISTEFMICSSGWGTTRVSESLAPGAILFTPSVGDHVITS